MKIYKIDYFPLVGTQWLTVPTNSIIGLGIGNGGDENATVRLFEGETELSSTTNTPNSTIPHYKVFWFGPTSEESLEHGLTATVSGNGYEHLIKIALKVVDMGYSTGIDNQASEVYSIINPFEIGSHSFDIPADSRVLFGLNVRDLPDRYFPILNLSEYPDRSKGQNCTDYHYIPKETVAEIGYSPFFYSDMVLNTIFTGFDNSTRHFKGELMTFARQETTAQLSSVQSFLYTPNEPPYEDVKWLVVDSPLSVSFTYHSSQGQPTQTSISTKTCYLLDMDNNFIGYALAHWLKQESIRIGARVRNLDVFEVIPGTEFGNYSKGMPWRFTNPSEYTNFLFDGYGNKTLVTTLDIIPEIELPNFTYTELPTQSVDMTIKTTKRAFSYITLPR